jgi:predicted DNA-binding ArsR family transcriptional regulator
MMHGTMFALNASYMDMAWGMSSMWLTRREILEQLGRLGIRSIRDLKKACREFEAYWDNQRQRV